MTRGYKGLKGVSGGKKRLQGVAGGYQRLQGVTRGDRGLQRILQTFFRTRTFPGPFSWSILHKNQS